MAEDRLSTAPHKPDACHEDGPRMRLSDGTGTIIIAPGDDHRAEADRATGRRAA